MAVAIVAGGCGNKPLERLPVAAGGAAKQASAGATADAAAPAIAALPFGRVEYVVKGTLPALASEAPAYKLAAGSASDDDVNALAGAFGLKGSVHRGKTAAAIRDGEREVRVDTVSGGTTWSLHRTCGEPPPDAVDPMADDSVVASCAVSSGGVVIGGTGGAISREPEPSTGTDDSQGSDAAGDASGPQSTPPSPPAGGTPESGGTAAKPTEPGPPPPPDSAPPPLPPTPPPARPADLPTADAARRIAADALRKAGVDTSGEIHVTDGFSAWLVDIAPKVGGLPTVGYSTSLSIGPKGVIVDGFGHLGPPERLGSYPLVGTSGGLDRLRKNEFAGPRPLGMAAGGPATDGPAAGAPAIGAPQIAQSDQVVLRTVTGVHLALELVGNRLVPVYVFELEGGETVAPVPAVVDRLLVQPPTSPVDKGRPVPVPQTAVPQTAVPPAKPAP